MLKRTIDADHIELSGRGARHSHQPSTVLLLARLWRLQQVILVLPRNGLDRILDLVDLEGGEASSLRVCRLVGREPKRQTLSLQHRRR